MSDHPCGNVVILSHIISFVFNAKIRVLSMCTECTEMICARALVVHGGVMKLNGYDTRPGAVGTAFNERFLCAIFRDSLSASFLALIRRGRLG